MLSLPASQNRIEQHSPEAAGWRRFFDEQVELVMLLRDFDRRAAEAHAFQILVVEWLNRRRFGDAAAPNNRCAWCGELGIGPGDLRPHGTDARGVAWLHPDICWRLWREKRRVDAVAALREMGIAESAS
jgi:hypothetical protein